MRGTCAPYYSLLAMAKRTGASSISTPSPTVQLKTDEQGQIRNKRIQFPWFRLPAETKTGAS